MHYFSPLSFATVNLKQTRGKRYKHWSLSLVLDLTAQYLLGANRGFDAVFRKCIRLTRAIFLIALIATESVTGPLGNG